MPADDTIEERLDKALTAVEWYSEAVKARAEVARLREALAEIEAKPYRAEEVIARLRESEELAGGGQE